MIDQVLESLYLTEFFKHDIMSELNVASFLAGYTYKELHLGLIGLDAQKKLIPSCNPHIPFILFHEAKIAFLNIVSYALVNFFSSLLSGLKKSVR